MTSFSFVFDLRLDDYHGSDDAFGDIFSHGKNVNLKVRPCVVYFAYELYTYERQI